MEEQLAAKPARLMGKSQGVDPEELMRRVNTIIDSGLKDGSIVEEVY